MYECFRDTSVTPVYEEAELKIPCPKRTVKSFFRTWKMFKKKQIIFSASHSNNSKL